MSLYYRTLLMSPSPFTSTMYIGGAIAPSNTFPQWNNNLQSGNARLFISAVFTWTLMTLNVTITTTGTYRITLMRSIMSGYIPVYTSPVYTGTNTIPLITTPNYGTFFFKINSYTGVTYNVDFVLNGTYASNVTFGGTGMVMP